MKPDIQNEIESLKQLLEQFKGCWAWIEELLPSHSRLSVVLSKKESGQKLALFLPSCTYIRSPINWSDSQLELQSIDLAASPPKMVLSDASNNIHIAYEGVACWEKRE